MDSRLAEDLAELCARGEGQDLEYMRSFPENAHELAKEIAAFATSNTGLILIGVADDGEIVGIEGMADQQARDRLLRRLEGISANSVKPAVRPTVAWGVNAGRVVLAISVPKSREPLYYASQRPYIRNISSSRPAEPNEVIEIIEQYLAQRALAKQSNNAETAFYSRLARLVARILVWDATPRRSRHANPWLDEWRAECGDIAIELRELAADDVARALSLDGDLRALASALESVQLFQIHAGCGPELDAASSRAGDLARALRQRAIDPLPVDEQSIREIQVFLLRLLRKLEDLSDRAVRTIEQGNVRGLQDEVGEMGRQLMELSFYNLKSLGPSFDITLREIGLKLRLAEIARLLMDGGRSIEELVEEIAECARLLSRLLESPKTD